MGIAEKVPLMKEGHRIRNVLVGIGFFILLLTVLGAAMDDPDAGASGEVDDDESDGLEESPDPEDDDADEATGGLDDDADASESDESDSEASDDTDDAQPSEDDLTEEQAAEEVFIHSVEEQAPDHSDMLVFANHQGDEFSVEVETYAETEQDLSYQTGLLAGSYAAVVDDGHGAERMTLDLYGHQGDHAGSFTVQSEWAEQYNSGELTEQEFAELYLETFEGPEQ